MPAVLNIGLAVGNTGEMHSRFALAALQRTGAEVLATEVQQSNTEATLIATLAAPLSPDAVHALAVALKQEAIAQHDGTTGELYGPGADAWRPFNPAYFIAPSAVQVAA